MAVRYGKLLNEKDVVVAGVAVGPSRNRFTKILQQITSLNDYVLGADTNNLDRVLEKLVEILCRKPGIFSRPLIKALCSEIGACA